MQNLTSDCYTHSKSIDLGSAVQTNRVFVPTEKHKNGKYAFDINAYFESSDGRERVESFIKQGYAKAFNANMAVTMLTLLAIKKC